VGLRAILAAAAATSSSEPDARLHLHPKAIRLDGGCGYTQTVWLQNSSGGAAAFAVVSGTSGFNGALPAWLDVSPASGVVAAGDSVELMVKGASALPQWGPVGAQSEELLITGVPVGGAAAAAWPAGVLKSRYGMVSLHVALT